MGRERDEQSYQAEMVTDQVVELSTTWPLHDYSQEYGFVRINVPKDFLLQVADAIRADEDFKTWIVDPKTQKLIRTETE
jgi:hypothetical protein